MKVLILINATFCMEIFYFVKKMIKKNLLENGSVDLLKKDLKIGWMPPHTSIYVRKNIL